MVLDPVRSVSLGSFTPNELGFPLVFQRYTAIEGLSRPVFATFLPE